MITPLHFCGSLSLATALLFAGACSDSGQPLSESVPEPVMSSQELADARTQVAALRTEVQRVKDSNAIKRLQRTFGYYFDQGKWNELAELFSDDATLEYARDGVYHGKQRIHEYFFHMGDHHQGLEHGELSEHFQLMPVITLSADGTRARGRWRDLILKGEYEGHAWWGEGPFENEYIKEEGVWKISKLHWFQTVMVPYEGGWAANEDVNQGKYVSDSLVPDEPQSTDYASWPETFLPPFHFRNPSESGRLYREDL